MKLQGFSIIFALVCIPLLLVLSYYIQLQVDTLNLQNQYDTMLLDSTYDALSAFEINTANEDLSTVSDSLRTIIEASTNIFFNTLATNMGLSNASKSYIEPYIPAILYTLYDGYYIYAPTKVPEVLTNRDGVAVTVGADGVNINNGIYSYNEPPEQDPDHHSELLRYADISTRNGNVTDYGQLLYKMKDDDGNEIPNQYTANINDAKFTTKNVLKSYMPYSAKYIHEDTNETQEVSVTYTLDNYLTVQGSKTMRR